MEPRICEGDVVIVQKQDDADSGDIVIACVNGDSATCKRLIKYPDKIVLMPLNNKYDPLLFTAVEVKDTPLTIIGKVVELRGKL
jgi:repressor LexA